MAVVPMLGPVLQLADFETGMESGENVPHHHWHAGVEEMSVHSQLLQELRLFAFI
jgi:hypothetical protein